MRMECWEVTILQYHPPGVLVKRSKDLNSNSEYIPQRLSRRGGFVIMKAVERENNRHEQYTYFYFSSLQ